MFTIIYKTCFEAFGKGLNFPILFNSSVTWLADQTAGKNNKGWEGLKMPQSVILPALHTDAIPPFSQFWA